MIRGVIYEYDMEQSNISLMALLGMIETLTYEELKDSPKNIRNVLIGKLSKEIPDFWVRLNTKRDELVKDFISINKVPKNNIIEIVNDAVWIYNFRPNKTKINDFILFRNKGTYSSILQINNVVKLYKSNQDIICRGGRIDYSHPLYINFASIYTAIENKINKRTGFQLIKSFEEEMNSNEDNQKNIISTVSNDLLLQVLKKEF
jgi:hypothetical protein